MLKVTIKTPERRHWRHSFVFNVNFGHVSQQFLLFLLLTLNKQLQVVNFYLTYTVRNVLYKIKNIFSYHSFLHSFF